MTPEQKAAAVAKYRPEVHTPTGFATVAVSMAARIYGSTGIKVNTRYIPENMADHAKEFTGKDYPATRAGMTQVHEDLDAIIKEARLG